MTAVTVQTLQCWGESHGKEHLETTSENRHWWCGLDMLGQTVPSTSRSNTTNSIILCAAKT